MNIYLCQAQLLNGINNVKIFMYVCYGPSVFSFVVFHLPSNVLVRFKGWCGSQGATEVLSNVDLFSGCCTI